MSFATVVPGELAVRRLHIRERKSAPRAEGLILKKIVVDAPNVYAPFESVVADDLRPVVDDVDVRFGSNPRL